MHTVPLTSEIMQQNILQSDSRLVRFELPFVYVLANTSQRTSLWRVCIVLVRTIILLWQPIELSIVTNWGIMRGPMRGYVL